MLPFSSYCTFSVLLGNAACVLQAISPSDAVAEAPMNFLLSISLVFKGLLNIIFLDLKMEILPDKEKLIELAHYRMPFGKFKGRYLVDLPEPYLVWFSQKGFPEGKLGMLLKSMVEIKVNGLEQLIRRVQKDFPPKKQ